MELNFKEYDVARNKEDEIYEILIKKSQNTNILELSRHIIDNILELSQHIIDKKDILMVRTLMSTLFKIRSKALCMTKTKSLRNNAIKEKAIYEEGLIGEMYISLNRRGLKGIKRVLIENASMMHEDLMDYYAERNRSYISDKFFIQTILDQDNAQELLGLNPFEINELLAYQQKPLTDEEKIIREIIDYFMESQDLYDSPQDLDYVKHLLYNNNETNQLYRKILFMISNVYQEAKEKDDSFYGRLMHKLDKTNYKPLNIINYINNDNEMLKEILHRFLNYNINIKEGRLEELEKKPSYTYAEKIYRKNP